MHAPINNAPRVPDFSFAPTSDRNRGENVCLSVGHGLFVSRIYTRRQTQAACIRRCNSWRVYIATITSSQVFTTVRRHRTHLCLFSRRESRRERTSVLYGVVSSLRLCAFAVTSRKRKNRSRLSRFNVSVIPTCIANGNTLCSLPAAYDVAQMISSRLLSLLMRTP